MDLITLRKKLIEKDFGSMNDRQFEAVTTVNGPLLVLAGAGSGKTTVLVNRIAYLVRYGNAYRSDAVPFVSSDLIEQGKRYLSDSSAPFPEGGFSVNAPRPFEILAITFTNKAAGELRERIDKKLGDGGRDLWAGTFHSVCGKLLRRNADRIGFSSHFTVYDTDDQRRLMKQIMKQAGVDDKFLPHRSVLNAISSAKDSLISPAEFENTVGNDPRRKLIAELYASYQRHLRDADAMDFDDMIFHTVTLLKENADVLEYYGNKFKYIMVDEYQDTNHAQYELVSLLASVHNNLCVVGDDDQSIYRFRGATIENILNFEEQYTGARTIRLEQNYRSTGNILNAANAVIENNLGRKGKTLWTDKGDGEKINIHTSLDEKSEARYVADEILDSVRRGDRFSQHAVLYRMNAQSASMENVFARSGISYKIIGGFRFFERKEVRDALAYLNLISNNNDDVRLRRIINEPKRGIGETTVNNASDIAEQLGVSLFEVLSRADEFAALSRAANKLKDFCAMIKNLTEQSETLTLSELFAEMLEQSGYRLALLAEGTEEAKERLENVEELASNIKQFEAENELPTLAEFLEEIALVSDTDSLDQNEDRVILMTIHAAKGLEFDSVYLIGMEEGIFPGSQSIYGGEAEIEEERRLAYVAITRARKKLTVTHTNARMLYGQTNRNLPSRFLKEIPESFCEMSSEAPSVSFSFRSSAGYTSKSSSGFGSYSAEKRSSGFGSYSSAAPSKPASTPVNYKIGQAVEHKTFGKGIILSVTPMSNDAMLEIAFDTVGTKKLMATFAKLKNI